MEPALCNMSRITPTSGAFSGSALFRKLFFAMSCCFGAVHKKKTNYCGEASNMLWDWDSISNSRFVQLLSFVAIVMSTADDISSRLDVRRFEAGRYVVRYERWNVCTESNPAVVNIESDLYLLWRSQICESSESRDMFPGGHRMSPSAMFWSREYVANFCSKTAVWVSDPYCFIVRLIWKLGKVSMDMCHLVEMSFSHGSIYENCHEWDYRIKLVDPIYI